MKDYNDELMHYGVLGMKWGRRKAKVSGTNKQYNKEVKKYNKAKGYRSLAQQLHKQNRPGVNSVTRVRAASKAISYDRKAQKLMKSVSKETVSKIKDKELNRRAENIYKQNKQIDKVAIKYGLKPQNMTLKEAKEWVKKQKY